MRITKLIHYIQHFYYIELIINKIVILFIFLETFISVMHLLIKIKFVQFYHLFLKYILLI